MTRLPTLALLFAALLAPACREASVEQIDTAEKVPVNVEPAQTGAIDATVNVSGVVAPAPGGDWTIVAPAPGRIAEIPKAEGDQVAPGDLLVRFDIPSLAADLSQHQGEVRQAQARLDSARAALTRITGLEQKGVAAAREVEEARRDQADAEAALAEAQSATAAATSMADRASIHATFAGVIAKRWHNPGDQVDAATSDPVLRVVNPKTLEVLAAVPVAALANVAAGQTAHIVGPGGGDPVSGKVITRPIQVDRGQPTADVRVSFNAATNLPVGASVAVTIVTGSHPNALLVPVAAVVREGNDTSVFVVDKDSKAHKRAVTTGMTSGDDVEITKGVAAGDRVIVRGQDGLPDGAAVTVAAAGEATDKDK
jgi:RND family efflux transporter MFP subunit